MPDVGILQKAADYIEAFLLGLIKFKIIKNIIKI